MKDLTRLDELVRRRDAFHQLDRIIFRDIVINGVCLRVLGIIYMDNGPDWSIKKHKHSFFELHYIVKNNIFTTLNGTEFEIGAGNFYVMPPGTLHSHRQQNNTGHIGFALRWELVNSSNVTPESCELKERKELIDLMSTIPVDIIQDNGDFVEGLLELLKMTEKHPWTLLLQTNFFLLIMSIIDHFGVIEKKKCRDVDRNFVDNKTANSAVRFIEENYHNEIDVKEVAEYVHMSYSNLSRIFKAYIGESINQYIHNVRIKNAQYLLKCTDKEIASIARKVGFQSEQYFSDAFRKSTGISPTSYRRKSSRLTE